ncbi:hypothetical protein DACRYDRAFT_52996 [Dacryopinax primogenitus]|uniref:Uncharacterized protein n=1 Tax=Dacryopinax primogenitus (strain DJM 731) TaxID=1858805 RepID=M5G053_DACPD|nr:uncharacterized protein DACRYDRAFT_52996 [Dacryopinax primogenitus]EJU01535.1 hypothetical protein DACRYDRAFT_52996 [Dacryopinax primogenitus]
MTRALSLTTVPDPFFAGLPHAEIHSLLYPDILHQLLQGILKHVVSWLKQVLGVQELDCCFRSIPLTYGTTVFKDSFLDYSCMTRKDFKKIAQVLVGAICGPPVLIMKATAAVVEFYYLASLPTHSDCTLPLLRWALLDFHKNKWGFTSLGVRNNKGVGKGEKTNLFCILKLHSLVHYVWSIVEGRALDGWSTEMSKRLHIDLMKNAF